MGKEKKAPTKDSWRLIAELFEADTKAEYMERESKRITKGFLECILESAKEDKA